MARHRLIALAIVSAVLGTLLPTADLSPASVFARETPTKPIPPSPGAGERRPDPALERRTDLNIPPLPHVPDLEGLSGEALRKGIEDSREIAKPRTVTHKKPLKGEDPRDPATVKTRSNTWLLFFLDDVGNLYQQRNAGTALEPYWQNGLVIVPGPVDHPDVVRRDEGETSTLGLLYLKTVASLKQVVMRTSTTDGTSWGPERQLTTEAENVYWLRVLNVDGTVHFFWANESGAFFYRTTTDFVTWSDRTAVGRNVGQTIVEVKSSFDIAKLANGTWLLAYLDRAVTCGIVGGCNDDRYPTLYTVVGSDLQSWGVPKQHDDPYNDRWPNAPSIGQAPSGSVYLIYDLYVYPWGRHEVAKVGDASGTSWSPRYTFGCEYGIGCDGWHDVQAANGHAFVDDAGHVQALWQMGAGSTGVPDPYPVQLFMADLTAGYYYRPLPPYMDPAVNFGGGSLGDEHVNVSNGNLTWEATDYALGGLGPELTLARTYNSGDVRDGIFGFGWSFPYSTGLQDNADGSVTVANFNGRRDYYTPDGAGYRAPPGTNATLVRQGIEWELRYNDHTLKRFDQTGHLTQVRDPDGNFIRLEYESGRLARIVKGDRTISLSYDGNGRVVSVSLPLERTLTYGYDPNGNLTSFTDATGAVTRYGYESDHRLASVTDAEGRLATIAYTTRRRAKSVTDATGAKTTYAYTTENASGGTTTVTNPRGTQTKHSFDARNRQTRIEIVMPGGAANSLVSSFAYTADDQLASQTDPRGTKTTFEYDAQGNMTKKVEDDGPGRLNVTWQYTYTDGDLTQQVDPRGTVTDYTYDSEHHLTSQTQHLADGDLTWSFTYYANGLLETEKDPNGQSSGLVTSIRYDVRGYLSERIDPTGAREGFVYDAGGRLLTHTDKRGKAWSYEYDAADRKTVETDPLGHTVRHHYSRTGEEIAVVDARGVVTTGTYLRDGELQTVSVDAGSSGFRVTDAGFELGGAGWTASGGPTIVASPTLTGAKAARVDSSRRYVREIPVVAGREYGLTAYAIGTAAGQTARLSYEWRRGNGSVVSSGNVDQAVTTTGYLPLRLARTAAPADAAVLFISLGSTVSGAFVVFDDVTPTNSTVEDFDGLRQRTARLDANGHVTRFTYDAASRLTSVTDARGKVTSAALDKSGNVTRLTTATGNVTEAGYDALNRETSRTLDPAGLNLRSSRKYDAAGNVTSETDADSRTTTFAYDKAGRLVEVTDAANGVTRYAYDANGNVTSARDPRDNTRTTRYDAVDRVIELRDALQRSTTFAYDGAGNRTRRTDAKGVETTYSYDDASRLTGVAYSSGGSVGYAYDDSDRLTSMTDAHGVTEWAYSDRGLVTSVTQPTVGRVTYGYDAVGNRTSIGITGKTTNLSYNELDAIESVTDWAGRSVAYAYDDAGRLQSISLPNTIVGRYGYDAAGRNSSLAYERAGTPLVSFAYTFNGVGQRLTEAGPDGSTAYSYDALHRLTAVTYPSSATETFTYDAAGNRLTRELAGETTTYVYDDAGQLVSQTRADIFTTTYEYDDNGNRTRRAGTDPTVPLATYQYDAENRLTSVTGLTALPTEYRYDGAGNRYSKVVGGTTTTYTLDLVSEHAQVLAESDGTSYLFGHDLLALERAGEAHWFVPDALGTTRRITDGAGAIEVSYQYEAFGKTTATSGTLGNDVRFTGERSDDEAGLIFLRARHYDPSVGRFLQRDRWPYDARVSGDLNRYAYVRNDPANAVDPSGHFLDTFFDVASVVVSAWTYIQEPSDENRMWLAADVGAMFIPGIPAVAGWAGRAARATAGAVRRGAVRAAAIARAPAAVSRARPFVDVGRSAASRWQAGRRPQVAAPQAVKSAPGPRPQIGPGGPRPPDTIVRGMRGTYDGLPKPGITVRDLGVKPGKDIPVLGDGSVLPRTGGMSVTPNDPRLLPEFRLPRSLGGTSKDPVWAMNTADLPPSLAYRADPDNPLRHGFVEPSSRMSFDDFQSALASTQSLWRRILDD